MKTRCSHIVLIALFLTLINNTLTGQPVFVQKPPVPRSPLNNTLPFTEDWESQSFTTNNWSISGNEWVIDTINGNGGSSAKFEGSSGLTNYNAELTSDWIDSVNTGRIFVLFDVMLTDIAETGTEWFYLEVYNGSQWKKIDSLSNTGSFLWESKQYEISELVKYKTFKIRFETKGQQSANIDGWFVDNIEVYSQCDAPKDLDASFLYSNRLNFGCRVVWNSPFLPQACIPFIGYDNGENFSSLGLSDGGDFTVAIRWDAGGLMDYDSCLIKKMTFYANPLSAGYFIVKIWTGADADSLIYSDTLSGVQQNAWTTVTINDSLFIDGNLEYWFGYKIVSQQFGEYPAGDDIGPAVAGYGDLIKASDEADWDTLSNLGFDYNWNLEIQLVSAGSNPPFHDTLLGYNLYRAVDSDTLYDKIATVPQEDGVTYYEYNDYSIPLPAPDIICYKVNAIWKNRGDTCYSNYANALNMPDEDHVCLFYDAVNNQGNRKNKMVLFPNPADSYIVVQSENPIGTIRLYDLSGKELKSFFSVQNKRFRIDITTLPKGVYFIKTASAEEAGLMKFVK